MENIYEISKNLPDKNKRKNRQSNKKSHSIPIIRNNDDVTHEQFDPSSFSSSPPNAFLLCLKYRINTYN